MATRCVICVVAVIFSKVLVILFSSNDQIIVQQTCLSSKMTLVSSSISNSSSLSGAWDRETQKKGNSKKAQRVKEKNSPLYKQYETLSLRVDLLPCSFFYWPSLLLKNRTHWVARHLHSFLHLSTHTTRSEKEYVIFIDACRFNHRYLQ